jgi:hypothetical protein
MVATLAERPLNNMHNPLTKWLALPDILVDDVYLIDSEHIQRTFTIAHDEFESLPYFCDTKTNFKMTERELLKLEGTIRKKMDDIRHQRVSLKDSGIGGLMNTLKRADEALYDKILPEYKKMVADSNIFK